jgi:hypothetical protein
LTPVAVAVFNDRANVLRALLRGGARVDVPTAEGKTAIFYAVERGAIASLTVLLDGGVDPNSAITADVGDALGCRRCSSRLTRERSTPCRSCSRVIWRPPSGSARSVARAARVLMTSCAYYSGGSTALYTAANLNATRES